jgi:hypothetical protein
VKGKSIPQVWRDVVRDSSLDSTAKGVAYSLSTWMSWRGYAFPARETIAAGAGYTDRTVDRALRRLESAGLLHIDRTKGGKARTNHYLARFPETANRQRRSEWETAKQEIANSEADDLNSEPVSHESAESAKESGTTVGVSSETTPP